MEVNDQAQSQAVSADSLPKHIPGEAGIWVLVLVDLCLFTIFFLNYLNDRQLNYADFVSAQTHINQFYGLINTVVLLCSSWLVVVGIQCARRRKEKAASKLFIAAATLGLVFLAIKIFEYKEKIAIGIVPNTNAFYDHYYFLTGLHFVHVVLGVGLLLLMSQYGRFKAPLKAKLRNLESGASFWHLVDLLWIALFALFYLLP